MPALNLLTFFEAVSTEPVSSMYFLSIESSASYESDS